jgi:hypothetical protein
MLATRAVRSSVRCLLAVALVALALAGTAGAAATDPQLQLAPADQAWAESILLTPADLGPGWQSASEGGEGSATDGTASALCPGFNPNESDLVLTGGSSSGSFARGGMFVASSGSTVWQTAEHAQADWDRMVQPQLLTCMGAALASGSTKKLKVVVRSKQRLPVASFTARTAAYRVAFTFQLTRKVKGKTKRTSLPATLDLVLFGSGRATALLFFVSLGPKPLSAGYEQSVAQAISQRLGKDPQAAS